MTIVRASFRDHFADYVQFDGTNYTEIETFLGSTLYTQCLRWYDTQTQEVFDVETTGDNIIRVFCIVLSGSPRLVLPLDYFVRYLTGDYDVRSVGEIGIMFVPTSEL
jgi:ABC-type transporter MlaC component